MEANSAGNDQRGFAGLAGAAVAPHTDAVQGVEDVLVGISAQPQVLLDGLLVKRKECLTLFHRATVRLQARHNPLQQVMILPLTCGPDQLSLDRVESQLAAARVGLHHQRRVVAVALDGVALLCAEFVCSTPLLVCLLCRVPVRDGAVRPGVRFERPQKISRGDGADGASRVF